jgi:hypothetical protein
MVKAIKRFHQNCTKTSDKMTIRKIYQFILPNMFKVTELGILDDNTAFIPFVEEESLGIGSEDSPFLLMITSKRLIKNLNVNNPNGIMLHLDTTFKMMKIGLTTFYFRLSNMRGRCKRLKWKVSFGFYWHLFA